MLHRLVLSLFISASICTPILTLALGASAAEPDANQLFQKGLAAYQNKQFAESKDTFQKLLDQTSNGGANSNEASVAVLHNLALSALQLDQKPWAIALWRKALSIDPRFVPARDGREFLESRLQIRSLDRDSVSQWTHQTLESLSLYELLWMNGLILAIAGGLAIRYWGRRRQALESEMPLPAFPTISLLLFLVMLGSLSAIGLKVRDLMAPRATVVVATVSARALPTADAVGLFDVSGGTEVFVQRHQDGWTQIQSGEGSSGWVKDSDIFVTSAN